MITITKLSHFCANELCGGVLRSLGRIDGGNVFQCRKCNGMFWADAVVPFDRNLKASVAAVSTAAAAEDETPKVQQLKLTAVA